MNNIEPTPETIAWICKNAEQAWQEGDPKKLQFWEDQKKEFQKKCYQRIESLTKQITFLQKQQELLIQKVKNGEYTPEEANQINRQIYEHREEIQKQIQFYRQLIQYPTESGQNLDSQNKNSQSTPSIESEPRFQTVLPLHQYIYKVVKTVLHAVFLSNAGQIALCSVILIVSVYFTWTWNTKNQSPRFEAISTESGDIPLIRFSNHGMINAKLYLNHIDKWEFAPYIYSVECLIVEPSSLNKKAIEIPVNCLFMNDEIRSPMPSTYIEVTPGSEKSFGIDTTCIKQTFPQVTKLILYVRTFYFHKEVFKIDLTLPTISTTL
ncbi:MAG TPA: hypothetical protein PLX23_02370 [Candidatus Hydrogenedens sp.]|nr:hypothetical protein [Candidatus Hydrogenedens sp.]